METRLISRCKKVVIAVMVVSTFIVVASATRAITARCFWGNKEVKARKKHTVWNQMVFIRQIVYSHYKQPFRWSTVSPSIFIYIPSDSPSVVICSFPPRGVRHLYFPRSPYIPVSPPVDFLQVSLSLTHPSIVPPVSELTAIPCTTHTHTHIQRIHCSRDEWWEGTRIPLTRYSQKNRWVAAKRVKSYRPASPE